jgi:hypothetical protein
MLRRMARLKDDNDLMSRFYNLLSQHPLDIREALILDPTLSDLHYEQDCLVTDKPSLIVIAINFQTIPCKVSIIAKTLFNIDPDITKGPGLCYEIKTTGLGEVDHRTFFPTVGHNPLVDRWWRKLILPFWPIPLLTDLTEVLAYLGFPLPL